MSRVYVAGDEYRRVKCEACGRWDQRCPYCRPEPEEEK